jgi:hypothetical protein
MPVKNSLDLFSTRVGKYKYPNDRGSLLPSVRLEYHTKFMTNEEKYEMLRFGKCVLEGSNTRPIPLWLGHRTLNFLNNTPTEDLSLMLSILENELKPYIRGLKMNSINEWEQHKKD